MNILAASAIGLIGWSLAVFLYNKLSKAESDKNRLSTQKEQLRGMISKELEGKYETEISELKRYQTHYLVHMEERDKILSSLSTLMKGK